MTDTLLTYDGVGFASSWRPCCGDDLEHRIRRKQKLAFLLQMRFEDEAGVHAPILGVLGASAVQHNDPLHCGDALARFQGQELARNGFLERGREETWAPVRFRVRVKFRVMARVRVIVPRGVSASVLAL